MGRKNLFEVIKDEAADYQLAHHAITKLLDSNGNLQCEIKKHFLSWKHHGMYVTFKERWDSLNKKFGSSLLGVTPELFFYHSELLLNFFDMLYPKSSDEHAKKGMVTVGGIIQNCLAALGYKAANVDDGFIICEIDRAATAVAELEETPIDVAQHIIQYNHFMLKGEIEKKRNILRALAQSIDTQQNQIKTLDKDLGVALFDLLNNMHIRHNNKDPNKKSWYRPHVVAMPDAELEKWYDEIYQMILLAMLLLDHSENRKEDVAKLREALAKKA